jgi:tRNA(Ile2)-agmatinylcytidine synthase
MPFGEDPVVWIGIDDTDSPSGGCTTWVLTELLREARDAEVDLIGEPRLVRLNPNVPWKTRGNAALAARFGVGTGPRRTVGQVDDGPVVGYARGRALSVGRARDWIDRAWSVVRRSSRSGEPGTDPALVATPRPLPARLYWNAVRSIVATADVRRELERRGATVRFEGTDQGLIGASAAIAWPGRRTTYELLAYRAPDRLGQPRRVSRASVRRAVERFPDLFLCEDPRTRRLLVAPHTPCPILFGLRATDRSAPLGARSWIRSEPVERWMLFRTNQGTGDHLRPQAIGALAPFTSGRMSGAVLGAPQLLPGGHVAFSLGDQDGHSVDCLAFEPTKTLPAVARTLQTGDAVRVWGSRAADPAVRLEGIEIVRLAPRLGPPRAPRCPTCRRSAHSLGRQRGYRCAGCRRRWPPESARAEPRAPVYGVGTYHPTPSARRHLAPIAPEP